MLYTNTIYLVMCYLRRHQVILIIGFFILLRVILTVNNNTFCFATIDKVFYYVASVLKYFVNCFKTEGIIIYS
jgi:hypothetical protein